MWPRNSVSTRSIEEPGASATAIRPSARHSADERPQHLHVLGRDRGHVDRAGHDAAGQRGHHLLGRLVAGAIGRLGRRCAQVRRDDHVRVAEQRMVGDRLGAEHVQRGTRRPCPSRALP